MCKVVTKNDSPWTWAQEDSHSKTQLPHTLQKNQNYQESWRDNGKWARLVVHWSKINSINRIFIGFSSYHCPSLLWAKWGKKSYVMTIYDMFGGGLLCRIFFLQVQLHYKSHHWAFVYNFALCPCMIMWHWKDLDPKQLLRYSLFTLPDLRKSSITFAAEFKKTSLFFHTLQSLFGW